jgi:predicted transcriptional regulator
MDKRVNRTVALLSIHPVYANRLLDETKGVELRRTKFSKDVDFIVIYSTSPVKKVVGYFSISQIAIDSPAVIWSKYQQLAGIKRTDFRSYYDGAKHAVAIEVDKMYPLQYPAPLSILGEEIKPPQSFQYLDHSSIEILTGYVPKNYQRVVL